MNNGGKHGISAIGAPSLIMIFVVLCLTCFAALSLVSANAQLRLAARSGEGTADYYAADAEAQERLMELDDYIDGILNKTMDAATLKGKDYMLEESEDGPTVTFYTAISDATAIETRALILGGEERYRIILNRTVVTAELSYSELDYIWDGSGLE